MRPQIQGIRSVQVELVYRQLPQAGPLMFGRGVAVSLLLDEFAFAGASTYLFGAVLEQFFARHVSLNSFSELAVATLQRGQIKRWPPASDAARQHEQRDRPSSHAARLLAAFLATRRRCAARLRSLPPVALARRARGGPVRHWARHASGRRTAADRPTPSLAFAPSTLATATAPSEGAKPRVSIYSFGLFGPNGPLPLHLTEFARDRARNHDDPALTAFADLFHHRLILLFYRAWADAQPTVSLDRGHGGAVRRYIASLIHLASRRRRRATRGCRIMPDTSWPDIWSGRRAIPEGLQQILRAARRAGRDRRCLPHWMTVERAAAPRVARTRPRARSATARRLAWPCATRSRNSSSGSGPCRASSTRLLPGAPLRMQLVHWVRHYLGFEWKWDVRLIMAAGQVTGNTLGHGQQLGWAAGSVRARACATPTTSSIRPRPSRQPPH